MATTKKNKKSRQIEVGDVLKIESQMIPESEQGKGAGDSYINLKQKKQKTDKEKLADYIVENYIDDLSSIAIDAGSTCQKIIEKMMAKNDFLSILTNNMTAFRQNSTQGVERSANEFILTGGKYVALFDALLGRETYTSFQLFNPNVVILGVSGLIPEKGFFCHGNDEVNIKELLFSKDVSTIIIPVDFTKLNRADSYLFGGIDQFYETNGCQRIVVAIPPSPENDRTESKTLYQKQRDIYDKQIEKLRKNKIHIDEVGL